MNDICYRRFNNKLASVKPFIEFIVNDLKLKQHRPLTILIDFWDFWDKELDGRVTHQHDDYTFFTVELNIDRLGDNFFMRELRDTIAHELRHVWQKVNDVKGGRESRVTLSTTIGYTQEQYDTYRNSPDEVDARQYAKKLVTQWDKRRR